MTPQEILDRIEKRLSRAQEEYFKNLEKWRVTAEDLKNEDDMFGWNFHTGMTAGAVSVNIYYYRIERELDAIRKDLKKEAENNSLVKWLKEE
jgi:hypothetical protein